MAMHNLNLDNKILKNNIKSSKDESLLEMNK